MKLSDAGLNLLKEFEGCVLHLYNDQAGHCTIGHGHLVHYGPIDGRKEEEPYKNGMTEAEASVLLRLDVATKAEPPVNLLVKAPLTQNQFDALCSFVFNIGGGAFAGSTLRKKLNAGDYTGAVQEFARWNKAGGKVLTGLSKRRSDEAALFLTPAPAPDHDSEISV